MDADDRQLLGIFFLQLFQVRENMHAVDSPECPKVEQNHFAFEVRNLKWLAALGVDPRRSAVEVRRRWPSRVADFGIHSIILREKAPLADAAREEQRNQN